VIKKLIIVILLILITGCSFNEWNTKDKAKYLAYTGLTITDTIQSHKIIKEGNELNPLFKNSESMIAIKFLSGSIIYILADKFPEQRSTILDIACIIAGGTVVWNFAH